MFTKFDLDHSGNFSLVEFIKAIEMLGSKFDLSDIS